MIEVINYRQNYDYNLLSLHIGSLFAPILIPNMLCALWPAFLLAHVWPPGFCGGAPVTGIFDIVVPGFTGVHIFGRPGSTGVHILAGNCDQVREGGDGGVGAEEGGDQEGW